MVFEKQQRNYSLKPPAVGTCVSVKMESSVKETPAEGAAIVGPPWLVQRWDPDDVVHQHLLEASKCLKASGKFEAPCLSVDICGDPNGIFRYTLLEVSPMAPMD